MSKVSININKKELKQIQEALLFKKLDEVSSGRMVVVIGDTDSVKETKDHYSLVYNKRNIEVIKKGYISKPEKMRFSRGVMVDRLLIQTTLGLDEYTTLMEHIGPSLCFYHLNKQKEK